MPPGHCAKQVSYGTDDMGTMAAVPIQGPPPGRGQHPVSRVHGMFIPLTQPAGASKTILISVTW